MKLAKQSLVTHRRWLAACDSKAKARKRTFAKRYVETVKKPVVKSKVKPKCSRVLRGRKSDFFRLTLRPKHFRNKKSSRSFRFRKESIESKINKSSKYTKHVKPR